MISLALLSSSFDEQRPLSVSAAWPRSSSAISGSLTPDASSFVAVFWDLPILGDLRITDEALADDILAEGKRQLSCGYNYHLAHDGQRISQVNITGNHVVVVAKGRAGDAARINDEAPNDYIAKLNDRAQRRSRGILI
jgi:hypothetical protein